MVNMSEFLSLFPCRQGRTHLSLLVSQWLKCGLYIHVWGYNSINREGGQRTGGGEGREARILHSVIEHNLETLALCSPQLPVKFI